MKCSRKRLTQTSRCTSRSITNCGWTTSAPPSVPGSSTVWESSPDTDSSFGKRTPHGRRLTGTSCGTGSSMMSARRLRKRNCGTQLGEPPSWRGDSFIPTWIFEGCLYDQFRTPSVISDSQNSVEDKTTPPKDSFSSEALVWNLNNAQGH